MLTGRDAVASLGFNTPQSSAYDTDFPSGHMKLICKHKGYGIAEEDNNAGVFCKGL